VLAVKAIDGAKAADDPAPLLTGENRLLFSALLYLSLETDAVAALHAADPEGETTTGDEFLRAVYETTASALDSVAHAARLLVGEASEFLDAKGIRPREVIDFAAMEAFEGRAKAVPEPKPGGLPRLLGHPLLLNRRRTELNREATCGRGLGMPPDGSLFARSA
jgi:hypothetical protein